MVQVAANTKVLKLAGNSHAKVAALLGYRDRRNVWPWTKLLRPFPPHHCKRLVQLYPDDLDLRALRPHDWQKHWPELGERRNQARS